ncbi:MAG: hypothetical protein IJ560_01100 [Alphaproteobacteria bacterium]|nr:hypothetical protein [Alphaproteobacteria bacterium]
MNMKEFLELYFKQLRFNDVPAEVRAQYDAYVKANGNKGDFRGNMKSWRDELMHQDANGKYVQNDLPDASDETVLPKDEAEKLFKAFQDAFRAMAASRDDFKKNDKANGFLDEYFGVGRMFDNAHASAPAEAQIATLRTLLDAHPELETALQGYGVWKEGFSFSDLKKGIEPGKKKYNTDPTFAENLKAVANVISGLTTYDPQFQHLGHVNLYDIVNNFDDTTIDDTRMGLFRGEIQHLMRKLHSVAKVRDVFSQYDRGKITKYFDKSKENIAYDDKNSKDYVPPKREDSLTLSQRVQEWVGKTYDEVFAKYTRFKGDRLYFSDSAKNIVKALSSAKIKPTDGLGAVLENASKIKEKLQYKSPTATDHFDWFVKKMTELKDTMPKAFDKAMSHGRQMRAVVAELIKSAVAEGKDKEAKAAMEVLSVIKYGNLTSKVMDAFDKEFKDFSLFSDSKLSWNKNEGVQFVTRALDKSIKAAFRGIGYGVAFAGNAIRKAGSRFHGNRSGKKYDIKTAQQAWETQNAADLAAATMRRDMANTADQAVIDDDRRTIDNLNRRFAPHNQINETNYDSHMANLEAARASQKRRHDRLERKRNSPQYQIAKENVDREQALRDELAQLGQSATDLNDSLNNIKAAQTAILADTTMPDVEKQARLMPLVQQQAEIERALTENTAQNMQTQRDYDNIINNPNWLNNIWQNEVAQYDRAERTYNNVVARNNRTESRLNEWKTAHDRINELQNHINARDEEIAKWDDNHKDKYQELMAYWDFLESGRDSHTGRMYSWVPQTAKRAQKRFDAKKDALFGAYLNRYQYVA